MLPLGLAVITRTSRSEGARNVFAEKAMVLGPCKVMRHGAPHILTAFHRRHSGMVTCDGSRAL